MASKAEKIALGLPETANDDEVLARIGNLVAAEQLLESPPAAAPKGVRIAVASLRGQDRYLGTFVIPHDTKNPLVLDVDTVLVEKEVEIRGEKVAVNGEAILAEITSAADVMVLRSDTPVTPSHAVRRYKPQ
jgi:hypothetical protein